MVIAMTLKERITLAERLPREGSLEKMTVVKGIRQKLVGFTAQQMHDYDIVPIGSTFVTGYPDQRINVTLTDNMVRTYASIIRDMSANGSITEDVATLYEEIVAEAQSLDAGPQEENEGE